MPLVDIERLGRTNSAIRVRCPKIYGKMSPWQYVKTTLTDCRDCDCFKGAGMVGVTCTYEGTYEGQTPTRRRIREGEVGDE